MEKASLSTGAIRAIVPLLLVMASLLPMPGVRVAQAATYAENFDVNANWTNVSGSSLSAYGTKEYADSAHPAVTFHAEVALRETSGTQDGFFKTHSGAYAWRLRNASGAFWQAKVTTGGVGTFSVWVRRWDSSPGPNYVAEYSTDNGSTWTTVQTIDNTWLGSSDWKQVAGTINTSNGAGDTDDIIIRIRRTGGERLMVDDFEMTDYAGDSPPSVASTTPADGATGVAVDVDIVVNFSENVTVTGSWYNINCSTTGTHTAAQSGGPQSFTLNPDSDFVVGDHCTVTIYASQVTDQDGTPDHMASDYSWSFDVGGGSAANVLINEVDADTSGADTLEFVELYDGGSGNTDLTGLVVVFFNGNGDTSYAAFDLDGRSTDANGYFVLGNSGVSGVDWVFSDGLLQNGADAVALYQDDGSSFPNGTPVTTNNLLDALVYDTNDADDAGLLVLLNSGEPQVNEDGGGNKDNDSNRRCPNGSGGQRNTSSYYQGAPTPDADNSCSAPPNCSTIPGIQGSGSASPCENQTVTISGCVTGVTAKGFYVQDVAGDGDSNTSDGIYVYMYSGWDNHQNLEVGYNVTVAGGTVQEYYEATEIYCGYTGCGPNGGDDVVKGGACTLPAPVTVQQIQTLGDHDATLYENVEFMRVQMSIDGYVQGPTKRFTSRFAHGDPEIGFIYWGLESSLPHPPRLFQDDYAGYGSLNFLSGACDKDLPDVDFGDRIQATDLIGVMGYHFDKWQLILDPSQTQTITVTDSADVSDSEGPIGGDEFGICTFNLENMFDHIDDGDGDVGDWSPADAAAYTAMLQVRAQDIVNELQNCTVIAVQEMEGKEQVWDDLEAQIEAAAGGAVDFEWDYWESWDVRDITVGILYNADRVTLVSSDQRQGCSTTDWGVSYSNVQAPRDKPDPCGGSEPYALFSRPPYVARLQVSGGPEFTIIVNHFKSKRSSSYCSTTDCTDRREAQANWVSALVNEYSATTPNVVVAGDLNDSLGSTPIGILDNATTNDGKKIVNTWLSFVPAADRYSYIFGGESDVLDYLYFSDVFTTYVKTVSPLHINADFADLGPGESDTCGTGPCSYGPTASTPRSSDHDPVFGRMGNAPTAVNLAGFDAAVQGRDVLVTWNTASEIDLAGFNLYRSRHADGPYTRLNGGLIPARNPGSVLGASYEWLDRGVEQGRAYYYELEQVEAGGGTLESGLVRVVVPYRVFLPLILAP